MPGFVKNGTECVKGSSEGQGCKSNAECSKISNAVCQDGKCQCDVGYIQDGATCSKLGIQHM